MPFVPTSTSCNQREEVTVTLFCLISVSYNLELDVGIAFYQHFFLYQLSYIIFFSVHANYLC